MDRVSKYITMAEATRSNTAKRLGIKNTPTPAHFHAMQAVAIHVFDEVRRAFGVPIYVSSFYRSKKLNDAIPNSSKKSQHLKGEAIDFDARVYGGTTNAHVFQFILNNLDFDQLIWEYGDSKEPDWIHVSYTLKENRRQALKAVRKIKKGKKTVEYEVYKE